MDFSILVILWIAFMVIEKFAGRKNKLPQNPTETGNFDIPTLPNDPNFPGEDLKIFQDEVKPAEVREKFYQQPKTEFKAEKNFRQDNINEKNSDLPLNLTADSAMNAIILSEILGKPKALRNK